MSNTNELTIGSSYFLAVGNEGSVWSYDGNNGRGWLLFSLVDGEDEKATRRVRLASVLGPVEMASPGPDEAPVDEEPSPPRVGAETAPESLGEAEATADATEAGSADPTAAETAAGAAGDRETARQEKAAAKAQAKAEKAADKLAKQVERAIAKERAKAEKEAAKAQAKAEKEAAKEAAKENEEWTAGKQMSRTLHNYAVGYVSGRNASGTATKTNGDELAIAWLAMDVDTFCVYASGLLGLAPDLYAALNPGQRRMNFGNRLRAAIRKEILNLEDVLGAATEMAKTETE